jgi:hypothetical protein
MEAHDYISGHQIRLKMNGIGSVRIGVMKECNSVHGTEWGVRGSQSKSLHKGHQSETM